MSSIPYSGYENKVKDKIERIIENKQDPNVFDVRVPMEKYTEVKNNERASRNVRFFRHVFVKMTITPTSWFLIRNTNGVTGQGPGSDPIPLTTREMAQFGVREQTVEAGNPCGSGGQGGNHLGPFAGFAAEVEEVHAEKETLKALINMFGRETSVELAYDDIETL